MMTVSFIYAYGVPLPRQTLSESKDLSFDPFLDQLSLRFSCPRPSCPKTVNTKNVAPVEPYPCLRIESFAVQHTLLNQISPSYEIGILPRGQVT